MYWEGPNVILAPKELELELSWEAHFQSFETIRRHPVVEWCCSSSSGEKRCQSRKKELPGRVNVRMQKDIFCKLHHTSRNNNRHHPRGYQTLGVDLTD